MRFKSHFKNCKFVSILDNKRSTHDSERETEAETDPSKRIEQAIYELGSKVKGFLVLLIY